MFKKLNFVRILKKNQKLLQEILYSQVFQSSTNGVSWLSNKKFAPSGAAANHSFLYAVFRFLDDCTPKSILEFGAGQTTLLTSQYINNKNKKATLDIIEDSHYWADFVSANITEQQNINIFLLEKEVIPYKKGKIFTYSGLKQVVKNKKYDLLLVDGLCNHGKNDEYSRKYIVDLVPDNLYSDFIIIIDDYERKGERNTVKLLRKVLDENRVEYKIFKIWSIKEQCIICSKNIKFPKFWINRKIL